MPAAIMIYNGSVFMPCDMAQGPCCCEAWHGLKDTLRRIEACYPLLKLGARLGPYHWDPSGGVYGLEFAVGLAALREHAGKGQP